MLPHGLFLHIHPRKSFFIHCLAYFLLKSDCVWCMYIKHGELTWLDVQYPQHKLVEKCSQYKAGTSWYKDAFAFNSWLFGIKVLKYNIDLYYHTWLYSECQMIENVLLAHGYASLWMQKMILFYQIETALEVLNLVYNFDKPVLRYQTGTIFELYQLFYFFVLYLDMFWVLIKYLCSNFVSSKFHLFYLKQSFFRMMIFV